MGNVDRFWMSAKPDDFVRYLLFCLIPNIFIQDGQGENEDFQSLISQNVFHILDRHSNWTWPRVGFSFCNLSVWKWWENRNMLLRIYIFHYLQLMVNTNHQIRSTVYLQNQTFLRPLIWTKVGLVLFREVQWDIRLCLVNIQFLTSMCTYRL